MRRPAALGIAGFALCGVLVGQGAPKPKHVEVATVEPRVEDVATIDGIVKAYYEVVSGPAGKPREWARDRTLYIKDLRFVPVDVDKDGRPVPKIVTHQQ